jgi:hypothetical protein
LGRFDRWIGACRDGAEDGRPQRTGLPAAADLHRPIGYVCVDLHYQRVLLGDAAADDDLGDVDAVLFHPVDDGERAECGRFDERTVNFRRRRVERLTDEEASQQRVGENRAVAVVPIECRETRLAGAELRGGVGQFRVGLGACAELAGGEALHEPVENVADGALARFEAIHAGDDRLGDDAAEARDVGETLRQGSHHAVAGAGSHDLHERPFAAA